MVFIDLTVAVMRFFPHLLASILVLLPLPSLCTAQFVLALEVDSTTNLYGFYQ